MKSQATPNSVIKRQARISAAKEAALGLGMCAVVWYAFYQLALHLAG